MLMSNISSLSKQPPRSYYHFKVTKSNNYRQNQECHSCPCYSSFIITFQKSNIGITQVRNKYAFKFKARFAKEFCSVMSVYEFSKIFMQTSESFIVCHPSIFFVKFQE